MSKDKNVQKIEERHEDDEQIDISETKKFEDSDNVLSVENAGNVFDIAENISAMNSSLAKYSVMSENLWNAVMPNYTVTQFDSIRESINKSAAISMKIAAYNENIANMFRTPAWVKQIEQLRAMFRPDYLDNISALTNSINRLKVNKVVMLSDTVSKVIGNYTFSMTRMQEMMAPFQKWIRLMYQIKNPFEGIIEKFRERGYQLKEIVIEECYDAKWFPEVVFEMPSADGFVKFLEVINHTRKSKSRIKQIDKVILAYYDDKYVENQKKSWRKLGLPEYMMRIFHQAVQAFHRKEYAITVIVLSTFWEGIINNKKGIADGSHVRTNVTKENFKELVEEDGSHEVISSFYNEYIMYQFNGKEDLIDDVPGRHGVAHGAYNGYPSRKAALNAILFTDFLLKLEPDIE